MAGRTLALLEPLTRVSLLTFRREFDPHKSERQAWAVSQERGRPAHCGVTAARASHPVTALQARQLKAADRRCRLRKECFSSSPN